MKPEEKIEKITEGIRNWFAANGPAADAVVGISGGKDSSIVAALLVRALGRDRVVGVMMPDGVQPDLEDSRRLCEFLGIRSYVVNIGGAVSGLKAGLAEGTDLELSRDAGINMPPRIRMATLYAVAQCLPNGGRVANTCNYSEDYVGYSTKYGDAAGDFAVVSNLTVTEVLEIGDALGLPAELVHKTPSDGLSGLSDEDKLGFTYAALDRYIRTGVCEDEAVRKKIDHLHDVNLHKLRTIPVVADLS